MDQTTQLKTEIDHIATRHSTAQHSKGNAAQRNATQRNARKAKQSTARHSKAEHSTAQHIKAKQSKAQHSIAKNSSTAKHSTAKAKAQQSGNSRLDSRKKAILGLRVPIHEVLQLPARRFPAGLWTPPNRNQNRTNQTKTEQNRTGQNKQNISSVRECTKSTSQKNRPATNGRYHEGYSTSGSNDARVVIFSPGEADNARQE